MSKILNVFNRMDKELETPKEDYNKHNIHLYSVLKQEDKNSKLLFFDSYKNFILLNLSNKLLDNLYYVFLTPEINKIDNVKDKLFRKLSDSFPVKLTNYYETSDNIFNEKSGNTLKYLRINCDSFYDKSNKSITKNPIENVKLNNTEYHNNTYYTSLGVYLSAFSINFTSNLIQNNEKVDNKLFLVNGKNYSFELPENPTDVIVYEGKANNKELDYYLSDDISLKDIIENNDFFGKPIVYFYN